MFQISPELHPAYQRRFRQYAAFLQSVGAADSRFAVIHAGLPAGQAEVRITYQSGKYDDGDVLAETRVRTASRELVFASGLRKALFHLSWYFDADRGPAVATAVEVDDLAASMTALGLGDDDVLIDGDGRRSGKIIQRVRDGARLVLIDTYGEVVPIASSRSAATLAYVVRFSKDLQASDIVERTAEFLPD